MSGIPVLAAPAIDPGSGRIDVIVPEGLSLAEIVAEVVPGLLPEASVQVRIALVSDRGSAIVPPEHWPRVRPRPGIRVIIRVLPAGDDALRTVLSIAVSVAAIALGGVWGASVNSWLGLAATSAVGPAIVGLGVNLIGALLINALIPPPKDEKARPNYSISGWRNQLTPDGAIPMLLGQIRVAPPFAAPPWTEIVGDWQYARLALCLGEGRVEITGIRIGETDIAEYDEVEIETREGVAGDAPLSLYPRQVYEEQVGVELTRPLPRDDSGEVIEGDPAIETPVVRTTGADAAEASIIIAFPAGLIRVTDSGKQRSHSVSIRIRQRLVTDVVWTDVVTLQISAKRAEGFYRQHSWAFPSRGRWQVELTMMTAETEDSKKQQRTSWAALQTIRPEYPLACPRPLALMGLRIKATHQISGSLDNINVLGRRICLDWDYLTETWVERATSNPASLYRLALQHPSNPKAVSDAGIDLDRIADWHDHCRTHGLTYDRLLSDTGSTLRDILTEIAAAGRARPRHDGLKWGVVIDRPASLIVDHVNPRNSWGFKASRTYAELPDALVVNFLDGANDFKPAQRMVIRPGYAGDILLTEALDMPWCSDATMAWREGYRRWQEILQRPDTYQVTQDGVARVATMGDTLALSHDVLSRTQWVGKVRSVTAGLIELDQEVEMVAGETYAIRWRSGLSDLDPIGTSTVRTVVTAPGVTEILTLSGSGLLPVAGDLVHFGLAASESFRVVVTGVERAQDNASILRLVDAADDPVTGIDALVEAATVPEWSSRVGAEVDPSLLAPAVPHFAGIAHGMAGTGDPDLIALLIAAGAGSTVPAAEFQVGHRPSGGGAFTVVSLPAADGGCEIAAYAEGDAVDLRVQALSSGGHASGWSTTVTITIGSADLPAPGALNAGDITVATRIGGATITVITPADANLARLQVYRSATGSLNRATDAYGAPVAAEGARSYVLPVGDQTRVNLIANGDMSSASGWTVPADVTIASGVATKVAGAASRHLTQAPTLTAGETLRVAYRVPSFTAGNARVRALGTTSVDAIVATAAGSYRGTLVVPASPGAIGIFFNTAAAMTVDDVLIYRPTAACLPQGTQYLWLEPQNAEGTPGPVSGPFAITID